MICNLIIVLQKQKNRVKWDHDLVFHHCWTFHTKRDEIEILKNMHVKIPFAEYIDKGYWDGQFKNSYSYLKFGLGHSCFRNKRYFRKKLLRKGWYFDFFELLEKSAHVLNLSSFLRRISTFSNSGIKISSLLYNFL